MNGPNILTGFSPSNVFFSLLTFALAWLAVRYQARLFESLGKQHPRSRFLAKMLEPIVRISLWFAATLICIQIFAPSRDAFLAALGSVAIAIGLGAQDLIKNVIGGLVILANRPFQVGDRVKIGEAYGEITHIGLQSTRLVTPGDTMVTIPNAAALNAMAFNANSGVPDCQVETEVYLPVTVDVDLALETCRKVAFTSPYLLLAKPVVVLVRDGFTEEPFLTLKVKAYVYDHRYEPAMQSDIVRRSKKEFLRLGLLEPWRQPTD